MTDAANLPPAKLQVWWRNPWRIAGWSVATGLLAVPSIAALNGALTGWTGFDFALAFAIVLGFALAVEVLLRVQTSAVLRLAWGLGLAACVGLVVGNGALGIVGSEDNPANLATYFVILVVAGGLAGSAGKAEGMSRTLAAAALASAFTADWSMAASQAGSLPPLVIQSGFMLAFAVSSALFWQGSRASAKQSP